MADTRGEYDAALVARAQDGDRGAFGLLVERYQRAVFAIAYGRLGDLEAAADVAQDAFLVCFEGLRGLRNASKFGPWIRRITRRLCGKWVRSELYRQTAKEALRGRSSAEETTPARVVEAREDRAILERAIDQLPSRLREALVLYHFEGRSLAEAGASLGISAPAVHMRVVRAKRRLRAQVAAQIERRLSEATPGRGFTARALAGIPVGSVCGKLGLNVMKVGAAEALAEVAQKAYEHASITLTGGAVVATKKLLIGSVIGLTVLVAGVGGYVVTRARNERGMSTIDPNASQEEGGLSASGETYRVDGSADSAPGKELAAYKDRFLQPNRQATMADVRELLNSFPELEGEERYDVISSILRDMLALNELPYKEAYALAIRLDQEGKFNEVLPLLLGLYKVAIDPNLDFGKSDPLHIGNFVSRASRAYHEMSGEEAVRAWKRRVLDDIHEFLPMSSGGYECQLRKLEHWLWDELGEEAEAERSLLAAIDALEAYLGSGDVETGAGAPSSVSRDHQVYWHDSAGTLCGKAGRYEDAIGYYEQALELNPSWPPEAALLEKKIRQAKAKLAETSIPKASSLMIATSKENLEQIGSALETYMIDAHESGKEPFPESLQDLLEGGQLSDPKVLIDPATGDAYRYIRASVLDGHTRTVVVESAAIEGIVHRLHTNSVITTEFVE